jgi:hypothetical protein
MVLLAVLGGIVATSLTVSMKATRQDQNRSTASKQLQETLEQLSRDVRVANPIRVAATNDVVVDRYRGTLCDRVEFKVSGTTLQRRIRTYNAPNGNTSNATNGCYNYGSPPAAVSDTGLQTFMTNLTTANPFSYLTSTGTTATSAPNVHSIGVSVQVTLTEGRAPIAYATSVTLRNQ